MRPVIPWMCLLAIAAAACAGETRLYPWDGTLDQEMEALILPQIRFRNADLPSVLHYIEMKAEAASGGTVKARYVMMLPKDFKPRYELTLDLRSIPFSEALRYLGKLAGVRFSVLGNTVIVQPDGPLPMPSQSETASASHPSGGSNPLDQPARPAAGGDNTYRTLDGTAQSDKSGYVAHRSMGGWPTSMDPDDRKGVNDTH